MERFTEDKRQLSEMLKLLIKLYYQLKDRKKLTDAAIAALEDFAAGVTGRAFKYDEKGGQSDDHHTIPKSKDTIGDTKEQVASSDGDANTGALAIDYYNIYNQMKKAEGLDDADIATLEDYLRGIKGVAVKHHKKGLPADDSHSTGTEERSAGDSKTQTACPDDADKGALVGHYKISATMTQFKSFAQAMALLENSKGPVHFILSGIQDTVDTSLLPIEPDLWPDEDGEGRNTGTVGKAQEIHRADMDDINKKINAAINNQEPQKIKYQKVDISSIPYRVYTVAPVSEFAGALLKAEPMEDNPCQILPIKLVSEKPGEKTVKQMPQQDGQREEIIDQSAFMEAIKQNLRGKKHDRISHKSITAEPKEGKPGVTTIIEAMNTELRKLPPAQIPQRITIKSNRREYPQSSSPQKSIIVEPQEESSTKAFQQSPQSWISFMQIARAVLVNFHIAFGSFERIKNCQECGNLFFEKKKGSRIYCSVECKAEYNNKLFGLEKRRCIENQNVWIRRELDNSKYIDIEQDEFTIDGVKRGECRKCEKCQKAGYCSVLINKNQLLCQKIAEQRKIHKRKRRSMDKGIID